MQRIHGVSRWMARAGGAAILLCSVLIALDVITRKAFAVAWFESYEITIYVFAIAVAFGQAYTLIAGAHIRVDVLQVRLPRALRTLLDAVALAALAAMTGILVWHAWGTVAQSVSLGARSNTTLAIPLVIPQSIWAAGLSWFALVAVILLARLLRLLWNQDKDQADALMSGRAMDDNDAEHLIAPTPESGK